MILYSIIRFILRSLVPPLHKTCFDTSGCTCMYMYKIKKFKNIGKPHYHHTTTLLITINQDIPDSVLCQSLYNTV